MNLVDNLCGDLLQQLNIPTGRSKSPRNFAKVCWRCGKEGHYKKQRRSKVEKMKGCEEAPSTEENASKEEGGDVYLDCSRTHADHEAWLVNSGASFHMTPHKEWFYEYERYMEVMFS